MSKSMIRRNIKKLLIIFTLMLLVGIVGLFLAIRDINTKYETSLRSLETMEKKVTGLEEAVIDKEEKLRSYQFMKYKLEAFDKRYPLFSEIVDVVYDKSVHYGFHPDLVLSMMQVESYYNPKAVSSAGAYGLMQINLAVWKKELGIDPNRIFEIDYNVDLGLTILKRYYIESKGNIQRALHLYNNGYKYNNTNYLTRINAALMDSKLENLVAFKLSQ